MPRGKKSTVFEETPTDLHDTDEETEKAEPVEQNNPTGETGTPLVQNVVSPPAKKQKIEFGLTSPPAPLETPEKTLIAFSDKFGATDGSNSKKTPTAVVKTGKPTSKAYAYLSVKEGNPDLQIPGIACVMLTRNEIVRNGQAPMPAFNFPLVKAVQEDDKVRDNLGAVMVASRRLGRHTANVVKDKAGFDVKQIVITYEGSAREALNTFVNNLNDPENATLSPIIAGYRVHPIFMKGGANQIRGGGGFDEVLLFDDNVRLIRCFLKDETLMAFSTNPDDDNVKAYMNHFFGGTTPEILRSFNYALQEILKEEESYL